MSKIKDEIMEIVEAVDEVMGDGYAKKNPELVGRVFQGEKLKFAAEIIRDALEREIIVDELKREI